MIHIFSFVKKKKSLTTIFSLKQTKRQGLLFVVCLNVPATCECISGTDLRRQFYVLPH